MDKQRNIQFIRLSSNLVFITDSSYNMANTSCTHGPCTKKLKVCSKMGYLLLYKTQKQTQKEATREETIAFSDYNWFLMWSSIAFLTATKKQHFTTTKNPMKIYF